MSITDGNRRFSSQRSFTLFFDGATSGGNPGAGGCGAVCLRGDEEIFRISSILGHVTNNGAEYCGLISGLRRLLRDYPIPELELKICGDSELVIKQLAGKYKVKSDAIRPYHLVALGLLQNFAGRKRGTLALAHIPREENTIADELAKEATKTKPSPGDCLVFYPSICHLLDVTVRGKRLIAGQDVGAAARTPEILLDATTVLELFGESALKTLLDPGKTTFVSGKTNFTILGILREPFVLTLPNTKKGAREVTINGAVVVDFLPYDIQLSMNHPDMEETLGDDVWDALQPQTQHRFSSSVLPNRFQSHQYWGSNSIFIAAGYGIP